MGLKEGGSAREAASSRGACHSRSVRPRRAVATRCPRRVDRLETSLWGPETKRSRRCGDVSARSSEARPALASSDPCRTAIDKSVRNAIRPMCSTSAVRSERESPPSPPSALRLAVAAALLALGLLLAPSAWGPRGDNRRLGAAGQQQADPKPSSGRLRRHANDRRHGNPRLEILCGTAGADEIRAGKLDLVKAGAGRDTIYARTVRRTRSPAEPATTRRTLIQSVGSTA